MRVKVDEHTQEHLAESLQVEDVPRIGAMSPRTLMRRLNAEVHMTWGQYLLRARMLRAMEHLARGMTVTETAYDVGYCTFPPRTSQAPSFVPRVESVFAKMIVACSY